MKVTRLALVVALTALILCGALALAAVPDRPANCQPCGNEFKNVACGIQESPVEAYRANGNFVAIYSNRCFACKTKGVFCTVPTNAQ
ncbi:MAG: hypothetical protein OEQ13_02850 [Acidobacteriota bacterium]|nr:hypothetical protein [Acidobacteriota bacterium]